MDTNELVAHGRARFDHALARQTLQEKYQAKMIFAYCGGMWRAGPELHSMISTCGRTGKIVLPDLYQNPILVDSAELTALSQERWHEQMTAWLIEHEQLNQTR